MIISIILFCMILKILYIIYLKKDKKISINLISEEPLYEKYIEINDRLLYLETELENNLKIEGKIENNIMKL